MAYNTKYILGSSNQLNEFFEVYLDYLDYIGGSSQITGAVDAIIIKSTSGDENKFAPILGMECDINIFVGKVNVNGTVIDDTQLTIYDLIAQHDNDIRVTVYRERDYTKSIFQGFVVVEDNSQPFLDPPFTLSIKALDGLGLLKNVDMVDTTGALYVGNISIEDWIGNILYKTGQTLNLRVYFPFYYAGVSEALPPLQQVFLNASTWQIGEITTTTDPSVDVFASEANDAYTALQAICTCLRARIFQEDGVWNFVCLYSYVDPAGMFYNESTGTLTAGLYHMNTVSVGQGLNYDVPVGYDQIIHPVTDDAVLYLKLATKWVKLNYTYDQSVNKICNQNLKLGNHDHANDGTISSSIYDSTITPVITFNYLGYDAFCFTHLNGGGSSGSGFFAYPSSPPNAPGGIREIVDFLGNQLDRFLYLATPTGTSITYFRASQILIDTGDIFQMSFSWRTKDNINEPTTGISYGVAFVYLYGDDGTFWALSCKADGSVPGNPTHWILSDSNFQHGSVGSPEILTDFIFDSNRWNQVSINSSPTIGVLDAIKAPVSGRVEVIFIYDTSGRGGEGTEGWFKNISITILPYLQGSYVELKGDYNFLSSSNNIKQTFSQDIQISDSPKRYFKGALVKSNGDLIPTTWHRRGVTESKRFTQLMGQIAYNNLNRILNKIEGRMRGLTWVTTAFEVKQAGYLNRYYFTNHPEPTKKFVLTSFEKDYTTGEGRCVFVEILRDVNDTGWQDPDTYFFQYLFQ
jgi:hypothetical protein